MIVTNVTTNVKWWLESCGMRDAQPIRFVVSSPAGVNSLACAGVRYTNKHDGNALYLLIEKGELESVYSRKHYYDIDGSIWYVAGYSTDECLHPPYDHYHPFGHCVILHQWPNDLGSIDDERYAPKPKLPTKVIEI